MKRTLLLLLFVFTLSISIPVFAQDYLFQDEFDTYENWTNTNTASAKFRVLPGVLDGQFHFELYSTGGTATLKKSLGQINVENKKSITFEYKVSFGDNLPTTSYVFPVIIGKNAAGESKNILQSMVYGTQYLLNSSSAGQGKINGISPNKTYIVKHILNFQTNKYDCIIYNYDDNSVLGKVENYPFSAITDVKTIEEIQFMPNTGIANVLCVFDIDYLRFYDSEFKVSDVSLDNSEPVRTDSDINVTLSQAAANIKNTDIKVTAHDGTLANIAISQNPDDMSKFNISFPKGLKYNENYTLTIGNTILNSLGTALTKNEINFTTEMPPLFRRPEVISKDDTKISASVDFINNTGFDKSFNVFLLVYNTDNKLIKATAEKVNLSQGETNYSKVIDITGLTNVSNAKLYVWSNMDDFNKPEVVEDQR